MCRGTDGAPAATECFIRAVELHGGSHIDRSKEASQVEIPVAVQSVCGPGKVIGRDSAVNRIDNAKEKNSFKINTVLR